MKINFRQGIVSYPESTGGQAFLQAPTPATVNILTGTGVTTVAFAQRIADYLHVENNPVTAAWSGLPGTEAWLYWDINPQTGVVSYGFTEVQPTSGATQPSILVTDQHWFDTTTNTMQVYDGTRFAEKIRVFAARIVGTTISPMGSNTAKPFAGTQVGINQTTYAGQILFSMGVPVVIGISGNILPGTIISLLGSPLTATVVANPFARSGNYIFATTETEFIAGSSQKVTNIRLESDVVTAQAANNMAAYDVVKYSAFGVIAPANYNDTGTTTIGMIVDDVSIGEVVTVVLQGTITNEAWNWTTVGQELFILSNGTLTASDPNITTPSLYPVSKPPVARVLNEKQIIFMQGLGKVGPRGLNPVSVDSIDDVTIYNPEQNQVLQFAGSPQLWRNRFALLEDLGNVEITSVSASQALVFSGSPQMWRNSSVLSAAFGSPIADEDFIQFDSSVSNWVNKDRRTANVGYFGVTPVTRNTSGNFVESDAGKAVFSSAVGSPIPAGIVWTLNAGVFELGDVITLIRRLNASEVTITPGAGVEVVSSVDGTTTLGAGSPFVGSPQAAILTLDNPTQATLYFVEIGSPGVDTWLINGTGVTFT